MAFGLVRHPPETRTTGHTQASGAQLRRGGRGGFGLLLPFRLRKTTFTCTPSQLRKEEHMQPGERYVHRATSATGWLSHSPPLLQNEPTQLKDRRSPGLLLNLVRPVGVRVSESVAAVQRADAGARLVG